MCPLPGPGNDIESCKVMQVQDKYMKQTRSAACGGGAGYMRFQGTKKLLTEGQQLNALVANTVKEVIKQNKCSKATDEHESGLE